MGIPALSEESFQRLCGGGADLGCGSLSAMLARSGNAASASKASNSRMTCQRVKKCGLFSISLTTGTASARSISRSRVTIIWTREASSSALLAPTNSRVLLSYSTASGAAPTRTTACR